MNSPVNRVTQGAIALATVFALSVLGYHFIGGYDLLDAIWLVVVTISTVGFSERSELPTEMQLLTIAVILFGVSAAAYTFGGLVQYLLEGEFDRVLGNRKMGKEISKLSGHVVVCGYGRIGEDLVSLLRSRGIHPVVVDNDPERTDLVRSLKGLAVTGDATIESVLEEANLVHARAIVTALPTDAQNVFIALTARNLCPDIQIIAISEHASSCKKLRQAGANKIVMPHRVGAQQMERMISRPTTADLFDLFAEASQIEMEMDELSIGPDSELAGIAIGDSGIREKYNLLIIGIKTVSGELLFNPPRDHSIRSGDTLMVIGPFQQIKKLKHENGLD